MEYDLEKYAKELENFLTFIKTVVSDNNIAKDVETEKNNETQDILHAIELMQLDDSSWNEIKEILPVIRNERRMSDNIMFVVTPLIDWIKNNQSVINALTNVLGVVRKNITTVTSRKYGTKTDTVSHFFEREQNDNN